MKLSYSIISAVSVFVFGSNGCDGFSAPALLASASASTTTTTTTTQLDAIMDRRKVLNTIAVASATLSTTVGTAAPAFAAEYAPKLQDMQQIYCES